MSAPEVSVATTFWPKILHSFLRPLGVRFSGRQSNLARVIISIPMYVTVVSNVTSSDITDNMSWPDNAALGSFSRPECVGSRLVDADIGASHTHLGEL